MINPFFTQRTKSKFVFAGPSKTSETLFKYISPELVPVQYGGLSRDGEQQFTAGDSITEEIIKPSCEHTIELPAPEAYNQAAKKSESTVTGDEECVKKKKKKRGKKKRSDSDDLSKTQVVIKEGLTEGIGKEKENQDLVCLYPFTSSSSATQRKIKQQYDQLVKSHESDGLTLLQISSEKMAFLARTKRVTDPLDDRVKDRIVGRDRREPVYVSNGSEHSAGSRGYEDDSSPSPCLSNLLPCFLHRGEGEEEEGGRCNDNADDDGCPVNDKDVDFDSDLDCESDRTDAIIEIVFSMLRKQNVDRFRVVLLAHVLKGMEIFQSLRPNRQILHRNMMLFLQNIGYNAAICKTKWESCGGLTAGNYEFIDVVRSDSGARYYIDLNFAGEFEIARQTDQFHRLSQHLPTVFVGKSEDLKQIVKLMSDAAKRSLKTRGLFLPPWRKNRFMQSKWFGPYRRTVNYTPMNISSASVLPAISTFSPVKCHSVGFNAVMSHATQVQRDPDLTHIHTELRADPSSFPPASIEFTGSFPIFPTASSSFSPFDPLHLPASKSVATTLLHLHRDEQRFPTGMFP
ncbi:hypothetical protein LXL04_000793 [Taraxacum kok-saghyz]